MHKDDKSYRGKIYNTLTLEEFIQPVKVSYARLLMVSNIDEIYNPKTGKGTLEKIIAIKSHLVLMVFSKIHLILILELRHFAIG